MSEEMDFLRQLIAEARDLPKDTSAGFGDMAANAWSVWTKKPKSAERIEDDRRAAYVLSKLNEKYPRMWTNEAIPQHLRDAAEMYKESPHLWDSAYEDREGDYPIYHATKWAQSLPAAIYATGKMVGNEVHRAVSNEHDAEHLPYPEAPGDYEYAVNTLTGGLTADAGILPKGRSYWHDAQGVGIEQERKPQFGLYPSGARDEKMAARGYAAMPQIEEGSDFLQRSGVSPGLAKYWGPAMDSALNFPSSLGPALNYAKIGRPLRALGDLALDYTLSTPHLSIPAAAKAIENAQSGKTPWAK